MRFTAAVVVILISGNVVLAQKIKEPVVRVRPAPGISAHSTVAPPPAKSSSAAELARIEQETASSQSNRTVAHRASASVKTTPALDLGKNKPIRGARSHRPANSKGH